jgi:preprotein translocase subunit YajC
MIGIAHAQESAAAAAGGGFAAFVPLILIFFVFYFLVIRPQQKKAKEYHTFLSGLKKGDKVLTGGGIHGTITGLTESTVTLEIADALRVKVHRGYIIAPPQAQSDEKQAGPQKG